MLIPNVGDIHSIHSSEMSGRSCVAELQDVLVEPSVFASRDTLSVGGPIPCQVGNPLSNKCHRVCLYTIYVEREMQAFY